MPLMKPGIYFGVLDIVGPNPVTTDTLTWEETMMGEDFLIIPKERKIIRLSTYEARIFRIDSGGYSLHFEPFKLA